MTSQDSDEERLRAFIQRVEASDIETLQFLHSVYAAEKRVRWRSLASAALTTMIGTATILVSAVPTAKVAWVGVLAAGVAVGVATWTWANTRKAQGDRTWRAIMGVREQHLPPEEEAQLRKKVIREIFGSGVL